MKASEKKADGLKKHFFKLLMILVVVILAVSSVALVYAAYYDLSIKEHYSRLHGLSMSNAAKEFDSEIALAFSELAAAQNIVPQGFYALGTLDDGAMTLKTLDGTKTAQLTDEATSGIAGSEKSLTAFTLDGNAYICFAAANERTHKILLQDYEDFVRRVGVFELENALLVNASGAIIAESGGSGASNLFQLISHESFGDIEHNKGLFITVSGKNKYVTAKKLEFDDYYTVGYTDAQTMYNFLHKGNRNAVIYIVAVAAVSFLGTFFIILFHSAHNNRNVSGRFSRGKYAIFIDKFGKIIYRNKKFKKEFHYDEIVSHTIDSSDKLQRALAENGDVTLKLTNRQGETRYIRMMTAKAFSGFRLMGTDITEIMNDYLKAKHDSDCDRITGLPGMRLLRNDYDAARKDGLNEKTCAAIIEITNGKNYREMFGTAFYEEALRIFAERLNGIFTGRVYKSSGLFYILTALTAETDFLLQESDRYFSQMKEPINIDNSKVRLEFKMGLSKPFYPRDFLTPEVPLLQARQILHTIKKAEGKRWGVFFDAVLKDDLAVYESKRAVMDLLERNELMLYYQPQFSVIKGRIIGFEGLTRINKRLNISIKELIELAEKNGSIIEIGEYVNRQAMTFAAELANEEVTVSINASPVQLMQEGFVENFLSEYRRHKIRKGGLAIEITESFLMSSFNSLIAKLDMLNKEGIAIHLDDFGVEYSSMLYLKKLPISAIKIDREFIKDIDNNSYSRLIANNFVRLATDLGLRCIAEGVETQEQYDALAEMKCECIQGYYIGKAVPKEEAVKLYNDYNKRGKKND